mgnify:FL=1|jgi:hypothetical protein
MYIEKIFEMKKLILVILIASNFSCKKNCVDLNDTHWTLFYKHNSTFNYYAESDLYFKNDNSIENYRNFDTILGTWMSDKKKLKIQFNNDDEYEGTIVSSDSMAGTLILPHGDHGVWYAKRK